MFGFGQKSKAVKFATAALSQLLQTAFYFRPMPAGFWQDPYVLGFLHGSIAIFAKLASGGKLAGGDLGLVARDVYECLNPGQGHQAISRIVSLSDEKNADFEEGMRNGAKCVMVTYGAPGLDEDPDVQLARKGAIGTRLTDGGEPLTTAEIAGALQYQLFNERIRARFG